MTKIAFFDVDGTMINVPHQLLKPTDKTIHALPVTSPLMVDSIEIDINVLIFPFSYISTSLKFFIFPIKQ